MKSEGTESEEKGNKRRLNHDLEVTYLKKLFRTKHRGFANYCEDGPVVASCNVTLDNDLANLKAKCIQNYTLYKNLLNKQAVTAKKNCNHCLLQQMNETNLQKLKTKQKLKSLKKFTKSWQLFLTSQWQKKLKRRPQKSKIKHSELVSLYYEVCALLDELEAFSTEIDSPQL